jgi:hypothetical protein
MEQTPLMLGEDAGEKEPFQPWQGCKLMQSLKKKKLKMESGHWWLTLVILATQEAESKRIMVPD